MTALTAAERMARTRARRRGGRIHIALDPDRALLEDALVRCNLLAPQDVDDRAAFGAAAQAALEQWAEMQLAPPAAPDDQDVARNAATFRFVPLISAR